MCKESYQKEKPLFVHFEIYIVKCFGNEQKDITKASIYDITKTDHLIMLKHLSLETSDYSRLLVLLDSKVTAYQKKKR